MKGLMPVLGAGGAFAVTALAGLGAGVLIAQRTGQHMWVLGGLFAGLAVGGFSAFSLLRKSM
ncbi:MAG TPA: hypothetical protein VK760_03035 [Candidatus Acidoferrales bacterium]|nr:hypothetical protein [Candidatus Acidoferrales bacterium]